MEYKFDKPIIGTIGTEKYECTIEWRNGKFISDEAIPFGGKDLGPDPFTILLSSVASCTLITMRMYIDRKGWDIPRIAVNVNMYKKTTDEKSNTIIDCNIIFLCVVKEEQKLRLQEIVKHCPISKTFENGASVRPFRRLPVECDSFFLCLHQQKQLYQEFLSLLFLLFLLLCCTHPQKV